MNPVTRALLGFAGLTIAAGAVAFGAGAPPEHCPDISVAEAEHAAAAAVGWLVDNQQPDGTWLYEYDRVDDVASDDYNIVRHAGVMSALYQAGARGYVGAFDSAERGLEWVLDNVVERHDWAGVTTSNTVQAGTNALTVAALAERRLFTGDDTYDEMMAKLGRFLTNQIEPSGALLGYYDLQPDQPRPDTYSIYYTGEVYWALGRLHRQDPSAGWGANADLMGHYMATVRDDEEDIWPPLADHWSGYGLAETAAFPERPTGTPLTDDELAFVRRQGGLIGQRVRSISQRFGPWGVAVRGTFTPRGGGYGVFGEGLSGLWRAAQLDDRLAHERGQLANRAVCIAGLAIDAQATVQEASAYAAPGKVEGAWFIDELTRMDDQQHALSALLMTIPILEAAPADGGHTAPSGWLWLIVVIATVNPIRAALAAPRHGSRSERVTVMAVGGLLGAVGLLLVGSASGWLLGIADVSRPAIRLAAGGLLLLSAGADLVGRPPTDLPSLEGRRAAVVPVAVPLFVRPALVIAGLSMVADHGLALYAGALLFATALLVLSSVGAAIQGARHLALTWLARLLSAVAVGGSIALIANAVFDL
jgi:small neutral amino acid transporter SnatA (MarC family)